MGVPAVRRSITRSRDAGVVAVVGALAAAVVVVVAPMRGAREPEPIPVRAAPPRTTPPAGFAVARIIRDAVPLRLRPAGRVVGRLRDRTVFGSPQRLAVVRRRGARWLGVTTPAVPNGRIGWVAAGDVRLQRVREAIVIDLSRRELRVLRGDQLLRRMPVTIGRRNSPTPVGRFHVTDKLDGPAYGRSYGCCILALSGRQPRLPPGWVGGDRLAIHGTPRPDLVGSAASAGCLHAGRHDLVYLMRTIRLGTAVFIRA